MAEGDLHRISVLLNDKTKDALDELARRQEVSRTEMVRRLVALGMYLSDEQRSGRKIVTMESDNTKGRELVIL
jgi:metal-responsive CopG/Arc/MetJ family transcriptional regulator